MSETNMNQSPQTQMQQAQQSQPNNQNQDLVNCDLANLESLNCNDSESDELLRQLTENTFELETFFSEFSTADIKVMTRIFHSFERFFKLSIFPGGKQ